MLVEDEGDLVATLAEFLEAHGHELDFAYDGRMGLALVLENTYDVVVLDLTLPRLDGLEVCRVAKAQLSEPPPVLMLTARDALADRLDGFTAGADDYLVKPFALEELEARIRALARRANRQTEKLRWGALELSTRERRVGFGGRHVRVTPTGFRMLELLMRRAPALVSRSEMARELWGST